MHLQANACGIHASDCSHYFTFLLLPAHPQIGMLAAEGKYDYLVIESSGISEPMQVGIIY